MSSDKKFEYESLQDAGSIGTFLTAITEGMNNGRVLLSTADEHIEFIPRGLLRFLVKARKKGAENKITLKIAWNSKEEIEIAKPLTVGR
ncbi:MAG: amphi-Trp domain-containing protein [Desulfarculales bacterium]|jgi:amphi-Trp domain-containing protein|nr:amphi-Trp domain-containing protein [Desulfarculales bacterium]